MTKAARMIGVLIGVVIAAALIAFYVVGYLMVTPPVIASTGSSREANLTLQTVASLGIRPAPRLGLLPRQEPAGQVGAQHDPARAGALARHVTVYQYDTATGPAQSVLGQPQGLVGKTTVDGKPITALDPDLASHTFAIPELGVTRAAEGRRRRREEPVQRRAVHAG